jgi:hypothetical protein
MLIICLVKENIFSILTLSGIWLKDTVWGNTMLGTELFPKLITD